jgi:hypothetical protein
MHRPATAPRRRPGRSAVLTSACALTGCLALTGLVHGQSPEASAGVAPVPVRIADGRCDAPGATAVELSQGSSPGPLRDDGSVVYLSVTQVDRPIEELTSAERIVLVGGADAEGAVACGALGAIRDDGLSVAALVNPDSGHFGTVLLRAVDQTTVVEVVVVAPAAPPDASPGPVGSAAAPSPPDAPGIPGNPTPEPGTSGAPPFSPLPAGPDEPGGDGLP